MIQSVRMGSPSGNMFRTNIGTKSSAFTKLRYLPNRVPDETKYLVDSVFDLDTGKLLNMIGILKLFLVVPMLILGIVLISIKSAEVAQQPDIVASSIDIPDYQATTDMPMEENLTISDKEAEERKVGIGNESLAPVWTGIMLAASAATDFIAVWRRRGSTIILYMLVSTVTFVVSILCIEYDRLEIAHISATDTEGEHWLQYRLYLACVVLASIGVSIGVLSIYVGSRMGALEESRLYMEREGRKAVLKKKDKSGWGAGLYWFSRMVRGSQSNETSDAPTSEADSDDVLSDQNDTQGLNSDQKVSHLVLAPQNLQGQANHISSAEEGRLNSPVS